VGCPTVGTVLDAGSALPGGSLTGRVHLKGGSATIDVEHITLEVVARVGAEKDRGEAEGAIVFDRFTVADRFRLAEGEQRSVPFSAVLPWEVPITAGSASVSSLPISSTGTSTVLAGCCPSTRSLSSLRRPGMHT
jgi:sporulation-control protein